MKNPNIFFGLVVLLVALSCFGQSNNPLEPNDFKIKMNQPSVTVLDVRTPEEYKAGHLNKAINVNDKGFDAESGQLDKATPVLVYCLAGKRSQRAAELLRQKGYKVYELKGGFQAWQEAGLPILK